jgi:hypothetical protein
LKSICSLAGSTKVLRTIFGHNKAEVKGGVRKSGIHMVVFYNLWIAFMKKLRTD